jgi:3-isopropylmalate/(R)-2-methylmalate dehydratase small subunit
MKTEGRVWKFGDHVDTDLIIPARFLNLSDPDHLARHCFQDFRPEFAEAVQSGDVIVAGRNFGCGSSREHAPVAIKASGISVIIARSFARIFYRNALNIGLPALESEGAIDVVSERDRISVDLDKGALLNLNTGVGIHGNPIPEFMREIVSAGGLVAFLKQKGLPRKT